MDFSIQYKDAWRVLEQQSLWLATQRNGIYWVRSGWNEWSRYVCLDRSLPWDWTKVPFESRSRQMVLGQLRLVHLRVAWRLTRVLAARNQQIALVTKWVCRRHIQWKRSERCTSSQSEPLRWRFPVRCWLKWATLLLAPSRPLRDALALDCSIGPGTCC